MCTVGTSIDHLLYPPPSNSSSFLGIATIPVEDDSDQRIAPPPWE